MGTDWHITVWPSMCDQNNEGDKQTGAAACSRGSPGPRTRDSALLLPSCYYQELGRDVLTENERLSGAFQVTWEAKLVCSGAAMRV